MKKAAAKRPPNAGEDGLRVLSRSHHVFLTRYWHQFSCAVIAKPFLQVGPASENHSGAGPLDPTGPTSCKRRPMAWRRPCRQKTTSRPSPRDTSKALVTKRLALISCLQGAARRRRPVLVARRTCISLRATSVTPFKPIRDPRGGIMCRP